MFDKAHLEINENNKIDSTKDSMTMTVDEMAEELNISRPTAYNLANSEDFFPAFKIKNRIVISRVHLMRWIDDQCSEKKKLELVW